MLSNAKKTIMKLQPQLPNVRPAQALVASPGDEAIKNDPPATVRPRLVVPAKPVPPAEETAEQVLDFGAAAPPQPSSRGSLIAPQLTTPSSGDVYPLDPAKFEALKRIEPEPLDRSDISQQTAPPPEAQTEENLPMVSTSLRPRLIGKTWDEHRRENRENLKRDPALADAPENKPSRLVAGIGMGLKAIGDAISSRRPLGEALGAGLGEGLSGAIFPKNFADAQNDYEIARIDAERERELKNREREASVRQKEAQADYTEQRPEIERDKVRSKVEAARLAFERRMKYLEEQQRFQGNQWEKYVDEGGKVWKKYKDGRLEPVVFNGEQDTDPSKLFYDYYDPITQQTVRATGGQIVGASATIQQGNAQREQQANTFNATQEFNAQKTNADNLISYNNQLMRQAEEIAKAEGKTIENAGELAGILTESVTASRQLGALPDDDAEGKNKLLSKIAELNSKYEQAFARTEAGKLAVERLKAQGVTRPPQVTPVRIQASRVGTVGQVSEAVFRERLQANNIPQSQWNQLIKKAKNDGVIK